MELLLLLVGCTWGFPFWKPHSFAPDWAKLKSPKRQEFVALSDVGVTDLSTTKGVAYVPSTAKNTMMMWLDFNTSLVLKEINYFAQAGANTLRVPLHWLVWKYDSQNFLTTLDALLRGTDQYKMKVIFVLFDSFGDNQPNFDWIASKEYRNRGWVANPGSAMVTDTSAWPALDAYVTSVVRTFATDPRVAGWDIFNLPGLPPGDKVSLTFVDHMASLIKGLEKTHFTLVTIIPGAGACEVGVLKDVDVIGFQNFNGNRGAVGYDTLGVLDCANKYNKQVLLTGTMARNEDPPSDLCESLFEAYGKEAFEIPAHPRIGVIVSFYPPVGAMIGVDEFSRSNPPMVGLVYPNGTWYRESERLCFSATTPPPPPPPPGPPPPAVNFTLDGLKVGLRRESRAIQVLGLVNDSTWDRNFSFVPPLWNFIPNKQHRDFKGCHHLGDITLRVQPVSETNGSLWATYSSALGGKETPVVPLTPLPPNTFDLSDITPALTSSGQIDTRFPLDLQVTRSWEKAQDAEGGLVMRFKLQATAPVRIGGLGFSIVPDTTWGGLNLYQVASTMSFVDPYIGGDHGYLTWTRADGSVSMLVTGYTNNTKLEAYRPVLEDASSIGALTYEWTVHSQAWAADWAINQQTPFNHFPDDPLHKAAWPNPRSPWPSWHLHETFYRPNPQQWNPPTSVTLQKGQSVEYALRFKLAPAGPRTRDQALEKGGHPVVLGIPGYVISTALTTAQLLVLPPRGKSISSISTSPPAVLSVGNPQQLSGNWLSVPVKGLKRGRVRVSIKYSDGSEQAVHYNVLPPFDQLVRAYGSFAADVAWLPREFKDPFGRSASVMPWDREDKQHILQDGRTFIVGLSDDAGAGSTLGFASKVSWMPNPHEVNRLDEYVKWTLYGVKNDTATPPLFSLQDPTNDRILMTLFYYFYSSDYATVYQHQFDGKDYYQELDKCYIGPSWCGFNAHTPQSGSKWIANYRVYNFPHQLAVYWALYRVAAFYDNIPTYHPPSWYLSRCYKTLLAFGCYDQTRGVWTCTPDVGVMDGTVFREIILALKDEGQLNEASIIEKMFSDRVFKRAGSEVGWVEQDFPYGSEFNWDTTGQEEVAIWGQYFNATSTTKGSLNARAVDAILAYMPSTPNWAYHGSAAGWGDFSNNAKWMINGGWEREGLHYRAGLNSIPLVERYRAQPDDFYLLYVGLGGGTGVLSNIDDDGAPSMGFHTFPFVLEFDPNSGDYGLAFFGHMMNAGAYVVDHPTFHWICFTCDLQLLTPTERSGSRDAPNAGVVTVVPRDSFRRRIYIEPLGLWLVSEAGTFNSITIDFSNKSIKLIYDPPGSPRLFSYMRLRVSTPAYPLHRSAHNFLITSPSAEIERGTYRFKPSSDSTPTTLTMSYS